MLFNEISRSYTGPELYSETDYEYLNRSARPEADKIRTVLEDWFSRYPKKEQNNLLQRLKSSEFESGFFELYLHEVVSRQGFKCQVEYTVRTPDFLVLHNDKKCFYLEATEPKLPRRDVKHNAYYFDLLDRLNEIKSIYHFSVGVEGYLTEYANLPDFIRWLQEAEKQQTDNDEYIKRMNNGAEVKIKISPKPKGRGGSSENIGIVSYGVRSIQTTTMINKAIKKKARHYNKPDLPFVIAINIKERIFDERMAASALFGNETITVNVDTGEDSIGRDTSTAALLDPKGRAKNTRVSGVLILHNLNPWNIINRIPQLWHTPWAKRPFPPELWQLPQLIPNASKGIYEKKEGKSISDLLHLPSHWPLMTGEV